MLTPSMIMYIHFHDSTVQQLAGSSYFISAHAPTMDHLIQSFSHYEILHESVPGMYKISSRSNFLSHNHVPHWHMIIRWDVYLTQECGGWMPIPFNWQGGVAIPRVPKKVEVASSFHSMNMAWVSSPFKKGCHDVWTLYQMFLYFVNTMT